MKVKQLGHFNISGSRHLIEQTKDFYVNIFGFQPGYRPQFDVDGYWLYLGDEPIVHLAITSERAEPPASPIHPDDLSSGVKLHHIALDCEGLNAYKSLLEDKGIDYQVAVIPEMTITQVLIFDPAGVRIELNFQEM